MALTELGERLALIIDARTDGAVTSIKRLAAEEQAAADRADVLKAKISDLETRAANRPLTRSAGLQLSNAKQELAGLESSLAQVPQGAGLADRALQKLGLSGAISGKALVGGFAAVAGTFAATGLLEFLKAGVEDFLNLAGSIRQVQLASGASAHDASALVAITQALGVNSDNAALGLFRLGKNIDLQPAKFAALGVSVARTKTGTLDLVGTLQNLATTYQSTTDPGKRAALVFEAFGRAGTTMLPILNANRQQLAAIVEEAQKSGRIFSQQDLNRARDLAISGRQLKDAFQGLEIAAARGLVPALRDVSQLLTDIANFGSSSGGKILSAVLNPVIEPFRLIGHFLGLGKHHADDAAAQIAAQQQQDAQDALRNAAVNTLPGPTDVLAGPQGLDQAKQNLASAVDALHKAREEQDKARQQLQAAQAGSPGASALALSAAESRLQAAEASLQKAEYLGGTARIASAQAAVATAQDHLNRLRAQGGTNTDHLATAEDRLRAATLKVTEAQRKAHDAQQAVNQATGLSAGQVLSRVKAQATSQEQLALANVRLESEGLSAPAIAALDKLEQQIPGTLVKVANHMNVGLAAEYNKAFQRVADAQTVYADAAATALGNAQELLGQQAAQRFADAYRQKMKELGIDLPSAPPSAIPPPVLPGGTSGRPKNLTGLLSPQVYLNGPITVSTKQGSPQEIAGALLRQKRLANAGVG